MRNSTIKQKYGICTDCQDGKEKPIIAQRCEFHYKKYRAELSAWKKEKRGEMNSFLKRKPIAKISKKHLENLKEYRKVRDEFMKQNRTCQARFLGCTIKATDIHHSRGKIGSLLTDVKYFKALCRSCHSYIETHPNFAVENGYSESRLAI